MIIKEIKMPKNCSKCNMITYQNYIRQKLRQRRMTLDEAIKHAEEVAEEKEEQAQEAQLQEEYSS